uniref:BZIP domain-containing protein n=1 Tax=Tetraselmis chuii TaxID=63592 RepID=A0A7S1X439_9CHLO|mmetsp:Transcript_28687/g.51280  ORF Transcript_28687/g.51280 Transcript_28687/m.51280 type:complete len:301 (+) Transcript_28687:322-1224(+)
MQAFYQPAGVGAVTGSPAGTPGVVAAPFYGAPASGTTQTATAATPYTAVWPGGQPLMYASSQAFYPGMAGIYPAQNGLYPQMAMPTSEAAVTGATAITTAPTIAHGTALTDAMKPPEGATTGSGATAIMSSVPGGAAMAQVVSGGFGSLPIAAGQTLQMTPEYWAQAQAVQAAALSQGQVRPGTALINPQNLAAVATAVAAATGQPVPGQEYFPMDEREQKRQRRKQSNRESARRSRLRKQAECEDLNKKVDYLAVDNTANLKELQRLKLLCDKLNTDNEALQSRLSSAQSAKSRSTRGK